MLLSSPQSPEFSNEIFDLFCDDELSDNGKFKWLPEGVKQCHLAMSKIGFNDSNKKFVSWKKLPAQTGMPFHGGNASLERSKAMKSTPLP